MFLFSLFQPVLPLSVIPLASTLSPEALSSFFRVFSSIEDFLVPLRPQGRLGDKSLNTSLSYQQGCNSLKNRTIGLEMLLQKTLVPAPTS